ncbi:hypothetical protein MHYP_G00085270 [Metynnis hypsauchen]
MGAFGVILGSLHYMGLYIQLSGQADVDNRISSNGTAGRQAALWTRFRCDGPVRCLPRHLQPPREFTKQKQDASNVSAAPACSGSGRIWNIGDPCVGFLLR